MSLKLAWYNAKMLRTFIQTCFCYMWRWPRFRTIFYIDSLMQGPLWGLVDNRPATYEKTSCELVTTKEGENSGRNRKKSKKSISNLIGWYTIWHSLSCLYIQLNLTNIYSARYLKYIKYIVCHTCAGYEKLEVHASRSVTVTVTVLPSSALN